jgi:hypothetical protein
MPVPSESKKKDEIGYELRTFSVLSYTSVPATFKLNEKEYGYGVQMAYFIPKNLRSIGIITNLTLGFRTPNTEEPPTEVVVISTLAEFSVENLEKYVQDKFANPPEAFLEAIANIAVSTSRGILMGKNFGTPYASFLLPIIPSADIRPPLPLRVQGEDEATTEVTVG